MERITYEKNGITLIALVITIIILLILSGITISNLTNSGIINKALRAKDEYQKSEIKEKIELYKLEMNINGKTLKDLLISDNLINENELEEKGIAYINDNYLVISDFNGLKNFSENVKNGNDYTGKTIYLINDIDCGASFNSETGELIEGENFEPISKFNGTFDGNDYTITNLYIKKNESTDLNTALFAILDENGIVENLTVNNSYIDGYKDVGAIVGSNYGTIKNCTNNSQILGVTLTGGIAGRSYNLIEACVNNGNIKTTGIQTGGIVGNCDFGTSIIVKNCKNYGNITSTSNIIGGIVGGAYRGNNTQTNVNVIISNCENYGNIGDEESNYTEIGGIVGYLRGDVVNCTNYGTVKGYINVGGIAGNTSYYNSVGTLIENCKNISSVLGKKQCVGGICGWNSGGDISKCSNSGEVTLNDEEAYFGVAGIAGCTASSTNDVRIEYCYNTGKITLYLETSDSTQCAGIVGNGGMVADSGYILYVNSCYNTGDIYIIGNKSNYNGAGIGAWGRNIVIKNCYNIGKIYNEVGTLPSGIWRTYDTELPASFENNYWLNTCGANFGIALNNSNEGAEPKTETELKALSEILGDDYAQDDKINNGYPYLKENKPYED